MKNSDLPLTARIYVTSRQQRNDPRCFKTVDVAVVVTIDDYDTVKVIKRRVEWDKLDAALATLTDRYAVRANSPHTYQVAGLRALRESIEAECA